MLEQVMFANVILLNKVDMVSKKKIDIKKKLIETLNPKACVITFSHGKVDLDLIMNTGLFSMKEAEQSSGWLQSLKEGGVDASQGEADEYDVNSFVYRARKTFHPSRLHCFLEQLFFLADDWNSSSLLFNMDNKKSGVRIGLEKIDGSILRSKGTYWIAGSKDYEIGWAQVGRIIQISPKTRWY